MTRARATRTGESGAETTGAVLDADVALRLSFEAWGREGGPGAGRTPWSWLDPSWGDRLPSANGAAGQGDAEAAPDLLRRSLHLQRRADLEQMHPTWWMRALKEE